MPTNGLPEPDPADPTDDGIEIKDLTKRDAARERWLYQMARKLAPWFAEAGHPLTDKQIGFGVGFTTSGNRRQNASIGQCHYPWKKVVKDGKVVGEFDPTGVYQVIIRIDQHESVWVTHILTHELCHVALPVGEGHKAIFRKLAYRMGLTMESKNTVGCNGATDVTPAFIEAVVPLIVELGEYPHRGLDFAHDEGENPKVKRSSNSTGIYVKCGCCGNRARISRASLERGGVACSNFECEDRGEQMLP